MSVLGYDCDVCKRPASEHTKEGFHPPDWFAGRVIELERENIRLKQELERKDRHEERWEIGFRNIVSILVGPRVEFEIKDIVEMVRALKPEKKEMTLDELGESYIERLKAQGAGPDVIKAAEKALVEVKDAELLRIRDLAVAEGHKPGYCKECSMRADQPIYH